MSNETQKTNRKKIKSGHKLRFIIGGFVAIVVLIMACLWTWSIGNNQSLVIAPNGVSLPVEIAQTEQERTQGLSGRKTLANNTGMLFVFEQPSMNCFWMKDMNFSIDIIWMDASGRVQKLVSSASPTSYPESFCPATPARYVLEIPAGNAEDIGIEQGAQLKLNLQ